MPVTSVPQVSSSDAILEVRKLKAEGKLKSLYVGDRFALVIKVCNTDVARRAKVVALTDLFESYKMPTTRKTWWQKKVGASFQEMQFKLPLRTYERYWGAYSPSRKEEILRQAHEIQAKIFGVTPSILIKQKISSRGVHHCELNTMVINDDEVAVDHRDIIPAFEAMYHEGVHGVQCQQSGNVPSVDSLMIAVQYYPGAYISSDESFRGYWSNPVEVEARFATARFVGKFNGLRID